jgi:sugar porter (SP) family MFS transporter
MKGKYGSIPQSQDDKTLDNYDDSEASPILANSNSNNTMDPNDYSRIGAFMIFFFPALGGLLFGYDIGATSAVVSQLKSANYSGVSWYDNVADSSVLQGVITSIGMFGAMLGSMTCFSIADDLGRRRSLLLASFLFIFGSLFEAFSGKSTYSAKKGIILLLVGRLIYGYGCGFAMHGAPAYIGEMAPPAIRGLLVSLKEAFIVLGMVLGYSIGYAYADTVGGWRYTYFWSCPFAVAMFFGMFYLPYSARWLALKGRVLEARESLRFVLPNLPESEAEAMQEVANKAAEAQEQNKSMAGDWKRLTSPTILPAMVAGVGLVFLQQVTGQPSVLYYADSIFEDVGLDTVASIGVSVFKLVATLFATITVDNYGRKLLLYIGCSLMLLALMILGTAFLFPYTSASDCESELSSDTCPSTCVWSDTCLSDCSSSGYYDDTSCVCCGVSGINTQKAVILTALFIYIGGYQVGFGPISWLLISEIFPLEVRGKAVSIAVVTNFFWNTIMTFFFPVELETIGTAATFYVYGVILAFGIYFIYLKVPETKGLSLEEIEDFFLRSSKVTIRNVTNGVRSTPFREKESFRVSAAI